MSFLEPKQSQNRCNECQYTWSSGSNLFSYKCPLCGSSSTNVLSNTIKNNSFLLIVVINLIAFFFGYFYIQDKDGKLNQNNETYKNEQKIEESRQNKIVDKEPDFGPYMLKLQKQIKRNWSPPKGDRSKKVVLLFTVNKKGHLLKSKVLISSRKLDMDKAALKAVEKSAPFEPLPIEHKGETIDVQFTFDYNVLNKGNKNN